MTPKALFARWRSRAAGNRDGQPSSQSSEADLSAAVERVVTASAALIGSGRDCRRDLRAPVVHALDYIRHCLSAVPGPITLAPAEWGRSPVMTALFIGPDEVRSFLASDQQLRAFPPPGRSDRVFGLLVATQRERTVFASAAEGDIVHRDTARTAVEFYDHRIIAPAATEAESRRELADSALKALVTHVIDRVMQRRALKADLKQEHGILALKLKIRQSQPCGSDAATIADEDLAGDAAAGRRLLEDIEREIREISAESDSPEGCLRQLAAVLEAPEKVLTVKPVCLQLDRMGFRVCGDATACAVEARLAEVRLNERPKQAAVFVTINREDYSQR